MNHRKEGQTQTEVANLMGVQQADVSRIEKTGKCTLCTFKSYLKACGKQMIVVDEEQLNKGE